MTTSLAMYMKGPSGGGVERWERFLSQRKSIVGMGACVFVFASPCVPLVLLVALVSLVRLVFLVFFKLFLAKLILVFGQ